MEKLELWQQNEPLFADKLNNEVKTVNKIIEKLNNGNSDATRGNMSSISYPQFGTTRLELLQMWDNDGEGIILSGNNFGFVGEAGLYARNNEVVLNGQRFIPKDRKLKKIADYSELISGGVLYQEITVANGIIQDAVLKYTVEQLPNDTDTKIYRKMSRIVQDCKSYTEGDSRGKLKAVAVNETKLFQSNSNIIDGINITTSAITQCTGCHVDCRINKQTYKLFEDLGTTKQFYGLSNEGGLDFVYSGGGGENPEKETYHGIRSGIEIYKVANCSGNYTSVASMNTNDPRPQYDKLASEIFTFPIKVKEYKNDGQDWVLNCTACKGAISLSSVRVACNNWQIGFQQSGEISIDTYKPTFLCFDPDFFCIIDSADKRTVRLNTSAIYDLANDVANNIQVCVVTCGIVDTVANGKIKVSTNGLSVANEEYTASTFVSKV